MDIRVHCLDELLDGYGLSVLRIEQLLTIGADDYVGKPFNPRELRAHPSDLRRSPPRDELGGSSMGNEVAHLGPFWFNLGTRMLRKRSVNPVLAPPGEGV
jgi:DNA-binding response OmpR family regulator